MSQDTNQPVHHNASVPQIASPNVGTTQHSLLSFSCIDKNPVFFSSQLQTTSSEALQQGLESLKQSLSQSGPERIPLPTMHASH